MDVYLIPLGADRYELYCEPRAAEAEPEPDAEVQGLMGRLKRYFHEVLAAAEEARKSRHAAAESRSDAETPPAPTGLYARLKMRSLAWIADKIAEQRLLWALRQQESATLNYPADLAQHEADDIARRILQRDADRHRWWLGIDTLLLLLSALLILLPGPNIIGYYFAFRVVGHYLSWRGARHALETLRWDMRASEELKDVRAAIDMSPSQRTNRLHDIASRLRLDDLPTFVERCAFPGA
jgi:hypothetical protein